MKNARRRKQCSVYFLYCFLSLFRHSPQWAFLELLCGFFVMVAISLHCFWGILWNLWCVFFQFFLLFSICILRQFIAFIFERLCWPRWGFFFWILFDFMLHLCGGSRCGFRHHSGAYFVVTSFFAFHFFHSFVFISPFVTSNHWLNFV